MNLSTRLTGLAYSGGNGVGYSGFVNDETSSALGGTLAYAGNAQGAVDVGDYAITPGGLASGNYRFTYVDGRLTVRAAENGRPDSGSLERVIQTSPPAPALPGTQAAGLAVWLQISGDFIRLPER